MGANGFSIREYTYKMRSVDVFNCWPFSTSSNVTRQDLQSWLPPMSLPSSYLQLQPLRSDHNNNQSSLPGPSRSFHDDYGSEQSDKSDASAPPSPSPNLPEPSSACDDEKSEMVCPVCREFNAATLTAVNAHMDGCLAQSVREDRRNHVRMVASTSTATMTTTTSFKSSKSKAPKKRSIAEIFKVQQEQEKEEDEKEKEKEPERIESVLKHWKKDSGGVDESVVDEVSITVTKFRWLSRRLEALRSGRRGAQSAKSDGGAGISAVDAAAEEEDEEKSEMVCPVCRDFNAATVTAVNAHIDNCLAQAVRDERRHMRRTAAVVGGCSKQKPKAPKKRSIAEILTVAPPIGASKSKAIEVAKDDDEEAEEDNGDEDKSDYSALDSAEAADDDAFAEIVSTIKSKQSTTSPKCTKKTKKVKKKKSKVEKHGDCFVSLNSGKKTIVNKKNKKKKRKKSFFNNEMTSKKEDACKRKVQFSVHSSRTLKATIDNKMVALHGIDPSTHEKKLGSKMLLVEKKQKVKNCDPIGKQQKAVSPVRGILKNHFKQVSGKTSSSSNTQDDTDEYHCDDELFTCKDDVLGPRKRNSFDETMFHKSSDVLATSLVKEQSSESDEESASLQTNRNYDYMAFNIDKRKEICSIVDSKEFSSTLEQATAVPNFLKPCTSEEKSMVLEENSETLTKVAFCDNSNLHPFDGGDATTSHCSPYADISIPLSTVEEVKMPGMNVQVCESGSLSSIRKFIDHLEDPKFHAARDNSCANTRTFLEPSSSYSASYDKGNEIPEFPLQTYGDNDNSGQASRDRQSSHMFGLDMTNNSFPYTGWGKGSVSNCQNANFFGLPLNSLGDLINFSSSGKLGTNQLETSSTLQGSLSGIPVNNIFHQGSQENLSINERHVVQNTSRKDGLNPFPHYPARLAVSELPCSEREDIHRPNSDMCSSPYVKPLNSEMGIMRSSSVGHNQHDWVLNHKGNGMVSEKESSDHVTPCSSQPTMRLMGKDVPIGRSTKAVQQFGGDNWADEDNRRQHYSEYSALESSFPERCSKQDWVSGSSLQMSIDNVVQSATIRDNQALPSTVLMNGPGAEFPRQFTDPQRNHVSQNGSPPVSRNASSYFHPIAQEHASCAVFNGAPDDFSERFVPGAKPLGPSSQSQVQPTPRNFSQPACFSNGELNERYKSPHVTKLASEFPFLQTALDEQAKTSWFQRSYRNLPTWLSNSTDERLPVTFSPQFSGLNSQSFHQNSWGNKFTSPSTNHSAEVLYPSNPLTSQLGSMKATPLCPSPRVQPLHVPTDRLKLDNMITKDHRQHPCTNTRKRPASALDDCRKPIKLPNIEVQENTSRMTSRLTGENSSPEMQLSTRAVKLDSHVDGARSRCCQNEAQKLNPTSYPAVDSFKLDSTVTSGPVRLDPRAKHILRSS